jgi:hypothetical protein
MRLGVLYAYHVFKSRPARYGRVLREIYERPLKHPRHRDLEFRLPTLPETLAHPQMRAIVRYLESREEDFFNA